MFTSAGASGISKAFEWIFSFANIHLPGLAISIWQVAIGFLLFRIVWNLALRLLNGSGGGTGYRSSSYHGKGDDVYKNWDINDTDWNSDW